MVRALNKALTNNAGLEASRQQAEREARLYKELADQANPTNNYPTPRHLAAGWGKFMAQQANQKLIQDREDLTPEQKTNAINAMGSAMISDFAQLLQASSQLGQASASDASNSADYATCLLYGALNLNEQQFGQVYGIIQKYETQAQQQGLLQRKLSAEATAQLAKINENAKMEIQGILPPNQAALLQNFGKAGLKYDIIGQK